MTTLEKPTERARDRNLRRGVAALVLVAVTLGTWLVTATIGTWLAWRLLGCSIVSSAPALTCVSSSEIQQTLGCEPLKLRELLSARFEQFMLYRRISIRVEIDSGGLGDLEQRCALQPQLAPGTWHVQPGLYSERRIQVSRSDDTTVVEIVGIRTFLQGSGDMNLDPVDP